MSLTPETILTKEDISYGPTLDADIFRMDDEQLRDYFGAVLLGRYFSAFASISFLSWTARLYTGDRGSEFGSTMAHLYKYAGKPKQATEFYPEAGLPQPYGEYTDPRFRERLENILVDYLDDFVSGRDVLARYGHTSENPWLARNGQPVKDEYLEESRQEILQGCLDVVSSILWCDGEDSMGSQIEAILEEMGEGTVEEFRKKANDNMAKVEISINPDHRRLLLPIKQLTGKTEFRERMELGNIIEPYLKMLE